MATHEQERVHRLALSEAQTAALHEALALVTGAAAGHQYFSREENKVEGFPLPGTHDHALLEGILELLR
jgi:hypothetical protein